MLESIVERGQIHLLSLSSRFNIVYFFTAILAYHILRPIQSPQLKLHKNLVTDISPFLKVNRSDVIFFLCYIFGFFTLEFFDLDLVYKLKSELFSTYVTTKWSWNKIAGLFLWTTAAVMVQDFCGYWAHRLMHTSNWLWFFHASHHSAKSINYYTVLRMHPLDTFIIRLLPMVGMILFCKISHLLFPQLQLKLLLSIIIGWEVCYAVTAILRHSSIPLNYPKWLSAIFLSPAMHLRHHEHTENSSGHKNFGRVFSIWDHTFKTSDDRPLFLSTDVTYGVNSSFGFQPNNFINLLYQPFILVLRRIRGHK